MAKNHFDIQGLTDEQVILAREKYGSNVLQYKKSNQFLLILMRLVKDPMTILLFVASIIYFINGKKGDGIFLAVAIIFQGSISIYQNARSKNALNKLKDFSKPLAKVYRNNKLVEINSEELVQGDSLLVEEGASVTADGTILHANDFSVNESILTGESMPVFKDQSTSNSMVYLGTAVASGLAVVQITAIGNETELGKIGLSIEHIQEEKTPLENQIANFVWKIAIAGGLIFIIVWAINYYHSKELLSSLLQSLTLAMSILPEEIPVAFTTFMALGAWRLMKIGIVVKQMKTVETLGSATVICTDKTGTLTENTMSLAKLFLFETNELITLDKPLSEAGLKLISLAMWASEPIPFDPMEVALHNLYKEQIEKDERPNYNLQKEYPLSGKPPMMTHVFENTAGQRIIAAKGAPESLMYVSNLTIQDKQHINDAIHQLAKDGYRLLGVGSSDFTGKEFPDKQQELTFQFKGIVAFYDPPKKNMKEVLDAFYAAGIEVKIVTGDNAATTTAIAKQIGFKGYEKAISGEQLMNMSEDDLKIAVMNTSIFTRMFPEAKLKIIHALKSKDEIVAMTGDGVNDAPALKAAHIGIAMGKRGTEIAKQAASLILLEDDLSKMVDAIAMGRKIYANLKKSIQYIISIHIPIILTVFIPLALGWIYPNIFSPIHIIFLEIIMGPTCSIIYENEPMEKNTMQQKPKPLTSTFFNWKELSMSMVQGLLITVATLFMYQYAVYFNYDEALTRTMVFTVLVTANIFLTLMNRSFYYSILTTLGYKNNMVFYVILITISLVALMLYVKPLTTFFEFETLNVSQLGICFGIGLLSVMWVEIVKWIKRMRNKGVE